MKINIKKIRLDLKEKGFVFLPGILKKNKNFKNLTSEICYFLNTFSKKNYKQINNYDEIICKKFKSNKKISGYLNENLNLLPSLNGVFADKEVVLLTKKILGSENKPLIVNNHRLRLQIPSHDHVANLPWHQDIHYNKIKRSRSLVFWMSLGNIDQEMGPIIIKSRSHKIKKVKKFFFKKPNGGKVPSVNVKKINSKFYNQVSFPTNSGDILILDLKLVHTSGLNKAKDRIKWSAQARFHVPSLIR